MTDSETNAQRDLNFSSMTAELSVTNSGIVRFSKIDPKDAQSIKTKQLNKKDNSVFYLDKGTELPAVSVKKEMVKLKTALNVVKQPSIPIIDED